MKTSQTTHKKIAIVVKYFYPVAAGIESSLLETKSLLAKKGWDITVHTTNNTYEKNGILPERETYRGIKIHRYSTMSFIFLHSFDSDIDILSLHNFNILPHVAILMRNYINKLRGKKKYFVLLTPHGGVTPDWKFFNPLQAFIKKITHRTIGISLINASTDYVRAVSEWEKNELIKIGVKKDKIITITNGLENEATLNISKLGSDEIKKKVTSFGKYAIQVGRVSRIKNIETAILAISKMKNKINLVVVGPVQDQKYMSYLEELVSSLKLEDRVFFIGPLYGVDKLYVMLNAQCMIHMSHLESFCTAVLEGMSQKLVCVVSKNGGALPFLIKNNINGYTVNDNDYSKVAKKVDFIIDNKKTKIITDIENTNRIYALSKSWNRIADQMSDFYLTKLNT